MITVILLQIGSFLQGGFETFYTWNRFAVAGISYRNHRIGAFYQEAQINGEGMFTRKGIYGEVCLGNVEGIAYFYGGFRLAEYEDGFLGFTPHGTIAWRITPWLEIPQTFSTYASRFTASIGLRFMYVPPRVKIQNKRRKPLQRSTPKPVFTHQ